MSLSGPGYGLDDRGSVPSRRKKFILQLLAPGSTQPPMDTEDSSGVKADRV
jgi:hypothetical protein